MRSTSRTREPGWAVDLVDPPTKTPVTPHYLTRRSRNQTGLACGVGELSAEGRSPFAHFQPSAGYDHTR